MANTDSFSNDVPLPERYEANRREARVQDAETIRLEFINSRRIQMPKKVEEPPAKELREDER